MNNNWFSESNFFSTLVIVATLGFYCQILRTAIPNEATLLRGGVKSGSRVCCVGK